MDTHLWHISVVSSQQLHEQVEAGTFTFLVLNWQHLFTNLKTQETNALAFKINITVLLDIVDTCIQYPIHDTNQKAKYRKMSPWWNVIIMKCCFTQTTGQISRSWFCVRWYQRYCWTQGKLRIPHVTNTRNELIMVWSSLSNLHHVRLLAACWRRWKALSLTWGLHVSCSNNPVLILATRNDSSHLTCVPPSNTTAERNQLTWHVLCNSGIRSNNSPNLEGISG
jgi:hypothetical protein